jgi:hypothetical protein
MSFGFSLGDFLEVIKIIREVRNGFLHAPGQFRAIRDELKSLSRLIEDVGEEMTSHSLSVTQQETWHECLEGCTSVVNDLRNFMSEHSLIEETSGSNKLKRVWERIKWDEGPVMELRARIASNISILNAFQATLIGYDQSPLLHRSPKQSADVAFRFYSWTG